MSNSKFKTCPLIYLNLVCHTDNGLLYYENKSLFERFPEITPNTNLGRQNLEVKFILKGHIHKIVIDNIHTCNGNITNCNGFGHKNKINLIYSTEPDKEYYYIDHFYSKSTEEFITFFINLKQFIIKILLDIKILLFCFFFFIFHGNPNF